MLGIDKRRHASGLLRLGNYLQGNGSFAGRFRAEDFHDTSARKASHAQRGIERNRARGNHRDRDDGFFRPQPHDGTFAKLLFNLCECEIDCFDALVVALFGPATFVGHNGCSCL